MDDKNKEVTQTNIPDSDADNLHGEVEAVSESTFGNPLEQPNAFTSENTTSGGNIQQTPNIQQSFGANYQTNQPMFQSPPDQTALHISNPGLIVLQWLTYAFWGWTIVAMLILTVTVFANFIVGTNDGSFIPYTVAATWVLLPISVVCDFFYSKQEPEKKTKAASVVMIIHSVLFALLGIGAFITIVVCLVELFTSNSGSSYTHVVLYSAMVTTVLYLAVFLRTLNIVKLKWFHRIFITTMIVIVGIFSVLGFTGPVANARITRNDTLIDNNLSTIQSSIDTYVSNNKSLPNSLNEIGLSGDAQTLVTNNLVQYIANVLPSGLSASNNVQQSSSIYYYQLCVDYKKSSASDGGGAYSPSTAGNNYSSSVNSYDHPAGRYCYKVSSQSY